jgi:hypothetical protein
MWLVQYTEHTSDLGRLQRKNYHSINVMGFCDASMRFLNIVAKWPGGTHNAFIWSNSTLCENLKTEL